MTMQPGSGPAVPAVAAAAGVTKNDEADTADQTTDEGVPVGSADAEADAQRTGAELRG